MSVREPTEDAGADVNACPYDRNWSWCQCAPTPLKLELVLYNEWPQKTEAGADVDECPQKTEAGSDVDECPQKNWSWIWC